MENYNMQSEKTKHPYNYYGKVYEETHGQVKFLLKSALRYVIDAYDEYLCSVEQSHYDTLDYSVVKNYNYPTILTTLDLTWMDKNDIFNFDKNEENIFVKYVKANIDNLMYSNLPMGQDSFKDIQLTVCNNNSKLNIVQQARAFSIFLKKHKDCLNEEINLEGFPPVANIVLSQYAKKYGMSISQQESLSKSK